MDKNKVADFVKHRILERFALGADAASQEEVNSNVHKGIMIKGTNLWVLIFAIFIASLGLNTNSTAVIIGAMLISPLMGPIIGMGYSMGVYDMNLLKESLRNFLFMIVVSLITSAILMATISVTAKSQIESVSDLVTFSKKDFADTIKIKMMHGQVVVPVEIEGSTKYLLFDTGSPIGLWFGEEEEWMKPIDTDSITFYDVNNQQNTHVMYQCKSMKLGSLVIEHYPRTVEATMRNVLCNEFCR